MPRMTTTERALYIAVVAAVQSKLSHRSRPLIAARIAHERAMAQLEVSRGNGKRKHA